MPAASTLQRVGSSRVWVRAAAEQASGAGPRHLLFCAWMGARPAHIEKYIDAYAKLYPECSTIVIRTEPDVFWSSRATQEAAIQPAAEMIAKLGPRPSLLVHACSNGGGIALVTLARMIARSQPDRRPALPARGIVFDSMPGRGDLTTMLRAFGVPYRNSIAPVRWLAAGVITMVFALSRVIQAVTRKPDSLERMRRSLLDPAVLPQRDVPVGFVYSGDDELIQPETVERQIALVRQAGAEVLAERLDSSPHVAHARTDSKRYWSLVQRVWDAAKRGES